MGLCYTWLLMYCSYMNTNILAVTTELWSVPQLFMRFTTLKYGSAPKFCSNISRQCLFHSYLIGTESIFYLLPQFMKEQSWPMGEDFSYLKFCLNDKDNSYVIRIKKYKTSPIWFWHELLKSESYALKYLKYRQLSNISRTLVCNKVVNQSDVIGTSPVGAAPTTSSFST